MLAPRLYFVEDPRGLSGRSRTRIYIARSMQRLRLSPIQPPGASSPSRDPTPSVLSAQTRVDRDNRRPAFVCAPTVGGYSSVICSLARRQHQQIMQVRCKTWEAKRQLACVRACMHDGERLEQRLVRTQYHSTKPCVLYLGLHDTGTTIIMWVSKQDGLASRLAWRWKGWPIQQQRYLR